MVICDWNGTLFRDRLEEAFFLGLCRRAFFASFRSMSLRKITSLVVAGARCYREYLSARGRQDKTLNHIARIVTTLNPHVFAGLSQRDLEAYARKYAQEIRPRLDERLLGPLTDLHTETSVPLGVVSSGCREGIAAALEHSGHPFDFVIANEFRMKGRKVEEFELSVMDNKADVLNRYLTEQAIDPAEVMYIGDSWQDEECFRAVGMPVVSFWATPENKQRFAKTCGAFVPETREDFQRYLRKVTGND
jgi:phosphoserine phosphatase